MKRTFGLIFWFVLLFMVLVSCIGGDMGADLSGTSWRLISLGNRAALPGGGPTLFFEEGGSLGGNSGCNSFGGEYKLRGSQIQLDQLFSTMMACVENDRMEQEVLYMQMLNQVEQYELNGGQLILTTSNGETLIFLPAD